MTGGKAKGFKCSIRLSMIPQISHITKDITTIETFFYQTA